MYQNRSEIVDHKQFLMTSALIKTENYAHLVISGESNVGNISVTSLMKIMNSP